MIRMVYLLLFPLLAGCRFGYLFESDADRIIGNWRSIAIMDSTKFGLGPKVGWELNFFPDGTFTLLSDESFNIQFHDTGRYSIRDEQILFTLPYRTNPWTPDFALHDDTLIVFPYGDNRLHIVLRRSADSIHSLHALPKMPQTVTGAASLLYSELDSADRKLILYQGNRLGVDVHFSYGMYIRNRFGLWGSNPALIKDCGDRHPDAAWWIIFDSLVQKVRSTADDRLVRSFDLQNELIEAESLSLTDIHLRSMASIVSIINDSIRTSLSGDPRYSEISEFHFELDDPVIADTVLSLEQTIESFQYTHRSTHMVSLTKVLSQILYPMFDIVEQRDHQVIRLLRRSHEKDH